MKKLSKLLAGALTIALFVCLTAASAFAATTASGVDWEASKIQVEGAGVAPATARTAAQAKLMARRAAIVDAYRQIAEEISGVQVDGETTIRDLELSSDVVKTKVSAFVRGARIVGERAEDGAYYVTMEAPIYGIDNSLAKAVLEKPAVKESFPEPVASVQPSTPSVDVHVTIGGTPSTPSTTLPGTSATNGSSAAAAPAGTAIGGYTGLIVDCRGLGLKPAMSPVIKNAAGQPIYGYKNLDYDKVVANGMAGYVTDMSRATRAGANPLVVKALRIDSAANPVLSTADANRVLIENGATGFLDATNVVFVR